MAIRTSDDQEVFYICGRCRLPQYAVKGEEPPVPCVDCGYIHRDRPYKSVPSEVKLDLTKY